MSLRKAYCGLFAATAAIGSSTWMVSNYIASSMRDGGKEMIDNFLNANCTLTNVTSLVRTPFTPISLEFTLEKISFTLHQALTEEVVKKINEAPTNMSENVRYAILAGGTIVLALTAGLVYSCAKNTASPTYTMENDKEIPLLKVAR